ncbi:MAG: Ppx/GppA family phosphatase [Defluviitaleaceae bacterium]|nr:Ppx/GppA family phosphatase [Defluviitaleaceae bacterium]MCL2273555.1 Ppx/GppA family phosphatase [Defluviitaleaceae bacterium]
MATPRAAVIDVGSNSVKYFLGELDGDNTLTTISDQNDIARLGEGLRETGALSPEAMERNASAITRFAKDAKANGASIVKCVGTMALRNASNSAEFVQRVKEEAAIDLTVIPGEEEARLSSLAVLSGLSDIARGNVIVFDTGGGSTEFVYGTNGEITRRFSIDLGAIAITERFFKIDPPPRSSPIMSLMEINEILSKGEVTYMPAKIVGIGGTVTTMGAVKHQMTQYNPNIIQGSTLDMADIDNQIVDYSLKTLEERKQITGLQPRRADVILAGACIVKGILTCLNASEFTISDRGLRHGLAYELLTGGNLK